MKVPVFEGSESLWPKISVEEDSPINHFVRGYEKRLVCVYEPLFGGSNVTYAVHLRLIEKYVVDFLLVTIELSSLDVTAEALGTNIDWKSPFSKGMGQFGLKSQLKEDVLHQSFFRFVKIHAFGRQTNGRTDRQTERQIDKPKSAATQLQRGKNERLISLSAYIANKQRLSLSPKTISILLCLKYWMKTHTNFVSLRELLSDSENQFSWLFCNA